MKVILNQDVYNLGEEGDVIKVKDGYARNFLLPRGQAVLFNKANQALFVSRAAVIEKRKEEKRKAASTLKERLDEMVINLAVSAGESGKLFGAVTSTMVQTALAKEGIEIERKRIEIASNAIKMVGTYSVRVRLYEGESAEMKIEVVSEGEVKKQQAQKAAADKEAARVAAAKSKKKAAATEEVVEEVVEEVKEEVYGAEGIEEDEFDEDDEE